MGGDEDLLGDGDAEAIVVDGVLADEDGQAVALVHPEVVVVEEFFGEGDLFFDLVVYEVGFLQVSSGFFDGVAKANGVLVAFW